MTNNVYVLFNVLSKRYGDVMCFPSDSFAVARIVENPMIKAQISEFELCRVGTINIDTGVIIPESPIRIALPTANSEDKE